MLTSNCTTPIDSDANDYYFDDIHNTISFRRPALANALSSRLASRLAFSDTESDDDDESLSCAIGFAINESKEAMGSPLRGSLGASTSQKPNAWAFSDDLVEPELKNLAITATMAPAIATTIATTIAAAVVPIAVIAPKASKPEQKAQKGEKIKIIKTRMTTRTMTRTTTTRFVRMEGGSLRNGVCFMKD